MAFYGESYPLNFLRIDSGCEGKGSWFDFNLYYHYDGTSDVFVPGDSFTVEPWINPLELTADDEVVVSWVLELGPATNGTIRLSAGIDPTWDANKDYATQPLGEHRVVGAQTLVAGPLDGVTAPGLADWSISPVVHIEILSGAVEIIQVKLRAWPPGGAGGAWVPAPPATATGSPTIERRLGYPTNYGFGNFGPTTKAEAEQGAILAAAGDFASTNVGQVKHVAGWGQGGDLIAYSSYEVVHAPFGTDEWTTAHASVERYHGFLIADRDLWPLPPRLGVHPNEIADEAAASVRAPTGGLPEGAFAGWGGYVTATYSTSTPPTWPRQPAVLEQHSLTESPFTDPDDPRAAVFEEYPNLAAGVAIPPGAPTETHVERDVPINAGSPYVALVANTPGVRRDKVTAADPAAGLFAAGLTITPSSQGLLYRIAYTDYLWFDPDLPWEDDDKPTPRFFWKDDLDQWRAIGPGKPADDLVLFKIKTAMGIYSEPAPGEEAGSGAHPLRVKVSEGRGDDSWDTPVWMQPEW